MIRLRHFRENSRAGKPRASGDDPEENTGSNPVQG